MTPESEQYVCPATHTGRCSIEGLGSGWLAHRCVESEGHEGMCECVCGERWGDE